MTAPSTPPHYFDFTAGGDDSMAFEAGARWVLEDFAQLPAREPRWLLDDDTGRRFDLRGIAAAPGEARLALAGEGLSVDLAFSHDPSGYVLVRGSVAGEEVLLGYIDRPWEEYDIWPAGAVFPARRTADAPGRIGKRLNWIVLDSRAWPALAPLANSAGFVLARAEE